MTTNLTRIKLAAVTGIACGLVVLLGLVLAGSGGGTTSLVTPTASTGGQIATVTYPHEDIQVRAYAGQAPQVVLTTPAADYTGDPVVVTFNLEYVNLIPDQGKVSNGIGFELYMDGQHVERMGLFGGHQVMVNPLFAPINLTDILDGARTPPAGRHTFSVAVWKWAPQSDGYLRAGDGMPMRLSVSAV